MFSNRAVSISATLMVFTIGSVAQSTHSVSVPAQAPSSAAGPVDRSFTGFAFEQSSFYNYSFDESGQPNTFSQNLINSVLERTGGTPLIRVGGTSGDGGSFNPSQENATNYPATEYGPRFNAPFLSVGPSYFEAFKNWPGAMFEFMVPLWHQDINNTVQWAKAGLDAIGDNLYSLEIGNEPNFYSWFSVSKYVDVYTQFETRLQQEFPKLANRRIFQALETAWGSLNKLQAQDAFEAGLSKSDAWLKQVGFHYYQGSAPQTYSDFQNWILHSRTVKGLAPFAAQINYMKKQHEYIGFVLSESADSLGGNDTDLSYRNTLATAVWGVDFMLQSLSLGVDRINYQSILKPGFCLWEPVASSWGPKQVRPNFYSFPFVADFIGKSGSTSVFPLTMQDDNGGKLAAYAAYDSGKLARIAVINVDLWRPQDGARPTINFSFSGLPAGTKTATIHHLGASGGALTESGILYKGYQWTVQSNGKPQSVLSDSQQFNVNGGTLNFAMNATSAILVEL